MIYTRFYNHLDSLYVLNLDYRRMLNESDTDFCVDVLDNAIIFPKCSYGLSFEQIRYLKEKHIDEIVLCGTDVDACVFAIALNLFDNGITPKFKWDLIASKSQDENVKDKMKPIFLRLFGKDSIID